MLTNTQLKHGAHHMHRLSMPVCADSASAHSNRDSFLLYWSDVYNVAHSNLCPCAMPNMLTSPFDNSNWFELNSKLGYASLMTSVHYFSHILQPRKRRNSAFPCHNRPQGVIAHFKSMLLLACMTKSAQGALVWPIELQAYQAQS